MSNEDSLSVKTSESKRRVGRSVSINGVNAVDVELKKSSNLHDPILNVNVKVNNPIGRLWLALKRIWKSQNTIIALKFTIPLIVLPIVIYVLWTLWQGRGVQTPMSKLGLIHEVLIEGNPQDILVTPASDVYLLAYNTSFSREQALRERPVIVVGTYKHLSNNLNVETIIPYNPADILPSAPSSSIVPNMWQTILRFIDQFK